jgi:WD40 repeat protein
MPTEFKYWAFISYSHADRKWGNWLHSALETYKVPRALVGALTASGEPVPSRIFPVFRDREELPTSSDLGTMITQGLQQSRFLIVICSPHAAGSRWVNQEILDFKRLGRENRILAMIVEGEPNASDGKPGFSVDAECFPEALRYALGADGTLDRTRPTEPIAADARHGMDGKTNARLKLLAGVLGINYDDLRRREERRRRRRQSIVVSVSAALVLLFAALAAAAFWQRRMALHETKVAVAQTHEAQRQKAEAIAQRHLAEVQKGIADEKSAQAEAEKEQVEAQTAADEEDLGREALLRGDPLTAAPHLILAYQARAGDPAARLLLHAAMTGLTGLSAVLRHGSGTLRRVDVAPKTGYILTVSGDGEAIVWDPARGAPILTLGRSGNVSSSLDVRTVIRDMPNEIRAISFAPDGNHILFVTVSAAFLENLATGTKVSFAPGQGASFDNAILSPDGAAVIGALEKSDGQKLATQVVAWNSANGHEIARATIPGTYAVIGASHSDVRGVLVGGPAFSSVRKVLVLDVATGKTIAAIAIGAQDDPEVSPRGDLILVNHFAPNNPPLIYSAQTGGQVAKLSAGGVTAARASWSPSGRYLLSSGMSGGPSEVVWDASTWKPIHVWPNAVWGAAAFDPQESLLTSASGYGTIDVWKLPSGSLLNEFNDTICAGDLAGSPSTLFSHLRFSIGSNLLVNTGGGTCATVWHWREVRQNKVVLAGGHTGAGSLPPVVNSVAFNPDGRRAVTGSGDGTATIWNAVTGAPLFQLSSKSSPRGAQVPMALFVSGGREVVTGSFFGKAALWNALNGSLLRYLDFDKHEIVIGDTIRVAVAGKGNRAVTFSSDGWGALWDLKSQKQLASLHTENGANVRAVAFAPDGSEFVVADASGYAFVFNARRGTLKRKVGSPGAPLVGAEIAPHDDKLLTVDEAGHIAVWSIANGRDLVNVNTAAGGPAVNEASFSPDGSTIAAACDDSKLRTWNAATGQPDLTVGEETLPGEMSLPAPLRSGMSAGTILRGMLHLAYSPDGILIAGASDNGHIMVWDATNGKQLLRFEGHAGRVTSLVFSADGNRLASSSEDGTARVWDVSLERRTPADVQHVLAQIHQKPSP